MKLCTIITVQISVLGVLSFATGCAVRKSAALQKINEKDTNISQEFNCSQPFQLAEFLKPAPACYTPKFKDFESSNVIEQKKLLGRWIPCNRVSLVSMASQKEFDFKSAIQKTAQNPVYNPSSFLKILQNPDDTHEEFEMQPAKESPNHIALKNMIRGAKHSLFFNAIIFGGSWGAELAREMLARKRNVEKNGGNFEIVILRDTENVFAFGKEINPVWEALVNQGVATKNFTVLRSAIHERPSALPFGVERLTSLLKPFVSKDVSVSGQSDHTKVLVADAFTNSAKMFVASKNPSDYNLLNYDESAIVEGPAATAVQISYLKDLKFAKELAVMEQKKLQKNLLSEEDKTLLENWEKKSERFLIEGKVFPAGNAEVKIAENNVDDSIRNAESTVLALIASAKKNVRIYNFLTYNPMVARAVADAILRLGAENVKVLSDATLTYALNVTFDKMVKLELGEKFSEQSNLSLKWRATEPPINFPKESGKIGITQQQHTKTIIVDDEIIFLGSTNFDVGTMAGAFRELSIAAKDEASAKESAEIFDRVWNSEESLTTQTIKNGKYGKPLDGVSEQLLIGLLKTEQSRTEALSPRNFNPASKCFEN